jgi:antitoxin YefM
MQTISFSDARDNLDEVLDRVVAGQAPVRIKRRGGKSVVLVSASEWAGMEETLHLMSSPANAKRLMEGIAGLDAGGSEPHDLIEPL